MARSGGIAYVYDEDGETAGDAQGRGRVTNHEYFGKVVRAVYALVGDTTEHGFVFRVDLALRPNGNSGPPAVSLAGLEEYLQVQGREWERFAWLKSRVVAPRAGVGSAVLLLGKSSAGMGRSPSDSSVSITMRASGGTDLRVRDGRIAAIGHLAQMQLLGQHLAGNGTGSHAHRRLARAGAATATVIAEAELVRIGVVSVRRAEGISDVAVILGALVGVLDDERNRRASGATLENAGQDFHLILFLALGRKRRRTRLATIQVTLQIRFAERDTRRHAIDNRGQRDAMRLARGHHPKNLSNAVTGHVRCSLQILPDVRGNRPLSAQIRPCRRARTRPR